MDKRPGWLLAAQGTGEAEVVPFDEETGGDAWAEGIIRWAIERTRLKARQRSRAEGTPPPEPLGRLALRLKRR